MIATMQAIALSCFLGVCGLILSELLLNLQQLMSARGYAFLVAVVLCWIFLDSLVTAWDLHRATTPDPTTQTLLLQMTFASHENSILRARLQKEISLHLETALALDRIEDAQPRRRVGFGMKRSLSDYNIARDH